ncbi:MAG: N-6 DNA methylase [Holophagaceae bacterium]|nr:N-6 DNA methylase [Holophagaceae bacterium]
MSRAEIFDKNRLKSLLDKLEPVPEFKSKQSILKRWIDFAKSANATTAIESGLEGEFVTDIFRDILGYSTQDADGNANLIPKRQRGDRVPDASLGFFIAGAKDIVRAVVELKSPGTDLNKKQGRDTGYNFSPVEQAFNYASKESDCRWIIVSDFLEIRIYHSSTQAEYETFLVKELFEENIFKKFYYLASKENLIAINRKSSTDALYDNYKHEKAEKISKDFYNDYKELRKNLFEALTKEKREIPKDKLFTIAQTILDRIIFIAFCEGRDLLPKDTLKERLDRAKSSLKPTDNGLWEELKTLFAAIDKGFPSKKINGFNGGLFKEDTTMDSVEISDRALAPFEKLLSYDYESDLDINILGHIFEQSVSDIEQIKSNLIGARIDPKNTKRKKAGIFYTPSFITHYITQQTVGAWLEAKRAKYFDHLPPLTVADAPKQKQAKGKTSYTYSENNKNHLSAWEAYRQELLTLKVLDPACGSGAFLTQALNFLLSEGKAIDRHYEELTGNIRYSTDNSEEDEEFHWKNKILANNIYGVDNNPESAEITKLSLWLNSAQLGKKLNHLDQNIKVGDSLVHDDDIAEGGAGFDWQGVTGFQEIMENGGFDIVIGNPPYVNIDKFGHGSPIFQYLQSHYSDVYMDKSDVLFYFIKKGIDLLKDDGILGFIVSNAFLYSDKAKKLRNYILKTCSVLKIVNFEQYQVFKDADITTCILLLQKNKLNSDTKVLAFKEKDYDEATIFEALHDRDGFFGVALQSDAPFALVNDKIAAINERIDGNHKRLGEILHVGKGMETAADDVFSIYGHKKLGEIFILGQGMQTAADDIYSFGEQPPQFPAKFIKKRISGKNIDRYSIVGNHEYVLYFEDVENFEDLHTTIQQYLLANKDVLSNRADKLRRNTTKWWNYTFPMHKEYYHLPKIICSRRAFNNTFVLDSDFEYMCFSNMSVIFCTNDAYKPEFMLALLNSELMNFRYKSIGKQTGGGSFEYFPNGLEKLPILTATSDQQHSLAQKAQRMIDLNKQLHKAISNALGYIRAEYKKTVLSKKLNDIHLLSPDEFLEEITASKIDTTSLKRRQELLEWFIDTKSSLDATRKEINSVDTAIDDEVYKLYCISDTDRAVIRGFLHRS